MPNGVIYMMGTIVAWFAVTLSAFGDTSVPERIATLTNSAVVCYTWESDRNVVYWSAVRNGKFIKLDVIDGTQISTGDMSNYNLTDPTDMVISNDIAAWIVPLGRGLGHQLQFHAVSTNYAHRYECGFDSEWICPVWHRVDGTSRVVVLGEDAAGPVIAEFDPSIGFPFRVEHIARVAPEARTLSSVTKVMGIAPGGDLICIGNNSPNGSGVSIVSVKIDSPPLRVSSFVFRLPPVTTLMEAVVCGEKIAWLVKRQNEKSNSGLDSAVEYELWSTDISGNGAGFVTRIGRSTPGLQSFPLFDRPHALRAKPDGSAVSYIVGNELYLAAFK